MEFSEKTVRLNLVNGLKQMSEFQELSSRAQWVAPLRNGNTWRCPSCSQNWLCDRTGEDIAQEDDQGPKDHSDRTTEFHGCHGKSCFERQQPLQQFIKNDSRAERPEGSHSWKERHTAAAWSSASGTGSLVRTEGTMIEPASECQRPQTGATIYDPTGQ